MFNQALKGPHWLADALKSRDYVEQEVLQQCSLIPLQRRPRNKGDRLIPRSSHNRKDDIK